MERTSPNGLLIGIDQDSDALVAARQNLRAYDGRIMLVHSNYSNLDKILNDYAPEGVDGILFDIGVSSHQLDEAERGFSYMQDAPLDMRMDQTQSLDAWQVVNTYKEEELQRILKEYGEERWAKRIAKFLVEFRSKSPSTPLENWWILSSGPFPKAPERKALTLPSEPFRPFALR